MEESVKQKERKTGGKVTLKKNGWRKYMEKVKKYDMVNKKELRKKERTHSMKEEERVDGKTSKTKRKMKYS